MSKVIEGKENEGEDDGADMVANFKEKLKTPPYKTESAGEKLPDSLPNRLACEPWAHTGGDFTPFGFDVWVDEAKKQFALGFLAPRARHDEDRSKFARGR